MKIQLCCGNFVAYTIWIVFIGIAACVHFHIRFIVRQRSRSRIEQNGKKNNRFFWYGSVVPQFDVNKMAMNENIKPKLYCMCYNEFHYMHVRVINKVLYLIAPKLNEQRQTLTTFFYMCVFIENFSNMYPFQ